MNLSGYLLTKKEGSVIYNIPGFLCQAVQYLSDSYGGGSVNMDRMAVLMYVRSRIRNFSGRHGSWRLVHHHRVGVATTSSEWAGIGAAFGNPYLEAILSYGVQR